MGTNDDYGRYQELQAAQLKEWESTCTRCGACCGITEGDPCEHLVEAGRDKYMCSIYDNRFGLHRTRSGKPFRCVPIRDILHKSWPGDHCCGYKKAMKICVIIISLLFIGVEAEAKQSVPLEKFIGMPKAEFVKHYPKVKARTYRMTGPDEWLTYNYKERDREPGTVTFHLKDGRVADWKVNDRGEVTEEYLSEYCSQAFIQSYPKIYAAIRAALTKLPQEAFLAVTDRSRPVIFTEYHYTGIGRFANSSNIISFADDAPSMADGLTMIKLSVELEDTAESSEEIEGIILHELAHRVLEHARKKIRTCQMEREANNLVKSWGYEAQFLKAKERFGDKTRTDAEKCPE